MDTLYLPEAGRRRRRYSEAFKADIVAACLRPGVSTSAIALENKINPNLLRRWIRLHHALQAERVEPVVVPVVDEGVMPPPALVPLAVTSAPSPAKAGRERRPAPRISSAPPISTSGASPEPIRLELSRGDILMKVSWPATQAASCAHWLRELLS